VIESPTAAKVTDFDVGTGAAADEVGVIGTGLPEHPAKEAIAVEAASTDMKRWARMDILKLESQVQLSLLRPGPQMSFL
jgi:hypothetical protein